MQVTVKTFAHLRDRLGFAERAAEVPGEEALPQPESAAEPR